MIIFLTNFSFAKELEIQYPDINNNAPNTTKTLLPDYIEYIFKLSLMIAGLVSFGALVYGGFGYMTSAGNPSKMDDAKQKIISAILGLIILLSSYLILITINPQLIVLQMPGIQIDKGVILYDDINCPGRKDPTGTRGKDYEKFPKSSRTLWNLDDKVKSIYFYQGSDQLKITLYTEKDYKGGTKPFENQSVGCFPEEINFSAKSIKMEWTIPGIHLYAELDYGGDERIYTSNRNTLGDFEDKTKSIQFVDTDLRAILHENENMKGDCLIYLERNPDIDTEKDITGRKFQIDALGRVSSITTFNHKEISEECYVTLYTEKDYKGDLLAFILKDGGIRYHEKDKDGTITPALNLPPEDYDNGYFSFVLGDYDEYGNYDNYNNKIKSIQIEGDCDVVLFEAKSTNDINSINNFKGKCEVYKDSDYDMSNNYSNTCGPFWPDECTSSLIILPTK